MAQQNQAEEEFGRQVESMLESLAADQQVKQRTQEFYLTGAPMRDVAYKKNADDTKCIKLEELSRQNVNINSKEESFNQVLEYLLFLRLNKFYTKGNIIKYIQLVIKGDTIVGTLLNIRYLTKRYPAEGQIKQIINAYGIGVNFNNQDLDGILFSKFGFGANQMAQNNKVEFKDIDNFKFDDKTDISKTIFYNTDNGVYSINDLLQTLSVKGELQKHTSLIWKILSYAIQTKQAITNFKYIPESIDQYVGEKNVQLPGNFTQNVGCTVNTLKYILGISPNIKLESEVSAIKAPTWYKSRFQQLKWVCKSVTKTGQNITEGIELQYDEKKIKEFIEACYL